MEVDVAHGEGQAAPFGRFAAPLRLRRGDAEGLLDEDVLAAFERGEDEGGVGFGRRGDRDGLDVRVGEEGLGGGVDG